MRQNVLENAKKIDEISFFIANTHNYLQCSFYHLPFVTLSTYFHIFIAFHILMCDFTSYTCM